VQLYDIRVEARGDRRHARHLKGAGSDHDLVRLIDPVIELNQVGAVGPADRPDAAAEFDWQVEVARVVGEVGRDLVPTGVAGRVAGEGEAR